MAELPTGWQYSALLIERTRDGLVEKYGEPITDEVVARHLSVDVSQVKAVMDSRATLGKAVFDRLAQEHDKTFFGFMADLIRWNRRRVQDL